MNSSFSDEVWKEIDLIPPGIRLKYAVSNYGRVKSFKTDISEGNILKGGLIGGYPILKVRPKGKDKTFYVHRLVAHYFLTVKREDDVFVLHLDYNKVNNHVSNLKWATKREMELHQQGSPYVKKARELRLLRKPQKGHKLTSTQVLHLKKKIFDPNRKTRLKILAKQFGISEMQLYRIKSGENWSHVKLEDN
ncbi:MAG: NUMOD4 domain-containing protein [Vicingaceae bacterium]